jgi:hypothetical protein
MRDGVAQIGHNLPSEVVMHEMIEQRRAEIEVLSRGLGIRRLDLFGSAVGGSFAPASVTSMCWSSLTFGPDSITSGHTSI